MRVKAGVVTRKKHKKVLAANKGYRNSYRKTYKRAHEAYMHAGQYSYIHRRKRIHQFRKLWVTRLTAAVKAMGYSYSQFMGALKKANITLNRKMLSELAIHKPEVFKQIVDKAFNNVA